MNEILKLIEERELYAHLILTKVYLATNGATNSSYEGNLHSDLKSLFGDDFNRTMFNTATQYLFSEGYVQYPNACILSVPGRRYFENFIKESAKASENDVELLKTNLPEKIVNYLGIASNMATVTGFLGQIIAFK